MRNIIYTNSSLYDDFLELCNEYYEINANYINIYRKFENIYCQENLNDLTTLIDEILNAKDKIKIKHKKILRKLNKLKDNIHNINYFSNKENLLNQISNIELFLNDYKNILGRKIIEFTEYRVLKENDILEFNTLKYLNDINLDEMTYKNKGKINLEQTELNLKNYNFDLFNNQII